MYTSFRQMVLKKLALLLLGITLYIGIGCNVIFAQSDSLSWKRDLSDGLKTAGISRKWVLVDVYTDWCGWCRKLDSDTYTNHDVVKFLNKSFVTVKVNGDDAGLGKYMKNQYGVNGYPTIIVLSPDGTLKGKFAGYRDPQGFIRAVSNLISN